MLRKNEYVVPVMLLWVCVSTIRNVDHPPRSVASYRWQEGDTSWGNNGKNVDGEDIPPTWIRVSVWRGYADVVAQFVSKGDRVTVVAERLKSSAYTSTDGEIRSSADISGNRRRDDDPADVDSDMIPF